MAKRHTYEEGEEAAPLLDFEERARVMLRRSLDSIQDLLDEEARGNGTTLSIEQLEEMDGIIKDARVQGLMS